MTKTRVAALISGRGSNMMALVEAADATDYPAEISLVLSNKADASGLDYAKNKGLATAFVDHKGFPDREAFDKALDETLRAHQIEFVCLAGFMRLLTPWFVTRWQDKLINIHPALLPSYKGLDTHARALADGVALHGCTVHYVRAEMDEGPILGQAAVPVLPDDTEADLARRVLVQEHRLYPAALAHALRATAGHVTSASSGPDQSLLVLR